MRDRMVVTALAPAAAVAGLFLAAPSRTGVVVGFTAEPPGFPWGSATTATAWGLLAALAVCVGARRVADALFVGGIAAVTLLVIGLSSVAPTLLTAVAAGVLLGSVLQLARSADSRTCAVATVIGGVAGVLVAPMLASVRARLPSGNRRFADYRPRGAAIEVGDSNIVDVGAAVLAVLAVAVLAGHLLRRRRDQIDTPARRSVVCTVALVVACALVHWWFLRFVADSLRDETSTGLHTFYGGYVALGLAVVVALVHRGTTGLVVLAAAASTVSEAADGTTSSGAAVAAMTVVLVSVGANVTATVLRRTPVDQRARGVVIAIGVLTVFTATQFVTDDPWAVVPILLGPFGIPVVAAMGVAAAVIAGRPDPATAVGALAVLVLTRLTTGSGFGWTSFTPLGDGPGFDGIASSPDSTPETVAAVLALGVCLVVAVILTRRRGVDPSVV